MKLIYIDPPYNTGRDFIYDNDFRDDRQSCFERSRQQDPDGVRLVANTEANGRFQSDWLSMLYPRLRLARNLLRDDGVLFISIDDNELAALRQVAAEVFGEQNFVATIVWQKVFSPKGTATTRACILSPARRVAGLMGHPSARIGASRGRSLKNWMPMAVSGGAPMATTCLASNAS